MGEFSVVATVEVVLAEVEAALGIPAQSQRWVLKDEIVPLSNGSILAETTTLRSGDDVTVVGFVAPLKPLPATFQLELESVRFNLLRTRCSSAFTLLWKMMGSRPDGTLEVQPWRKNDHDKLLFDCKSDTLTVEDMHWMCGTSKNEISLNGRDPLDEVFTAWHPDAATVVQDSDRFWRSEAGESPDEAETEEDRDSDNDSPEQSRPRYSSVPGWFTSPLPDLVELKVQVPLPLGRRGHPDNPLPMIIRLLVDAEGLPLRAAVSGCRIGGCHDDIEEYIVASLK